MLEGADAFILCQETSVGRFSGEAVIQLAKSIVEGENIIDYELVYNEVKAGCMTGGINKSISSIDIIATTACTIALESNVDIFVCLTETGKIAKFVAKYRPE